MKTILAAVAALFLTGQTPALGQKTYETFESDSTQVDAYVRTFHFHVPARLAKNPKLLFVLHGSGGSGKAVAMHTDYWFNRLADANGNVVVVYPDGYKNHWNECRKEANFDANLLNINDNTFFEKMIAYFAKRYKIDPQSVCVTGISNGGHEVFKLAKERPQWFKRFAAVAASLPVPSNDDCTSTGKPVSMMVINGTGDPINPYGGGEVKLSGNAKRGSVLSTDATMRYWAGLAQLDFAKATVFNFPDTNKADGATATQLSVKKKGIDIRLIRVDNGGHILSVPMDKQPPAEAGKAIQDINMATIIFDYFYGKS